MTREGLESRIEANDARVAELHRQLREDFGGPGWIGTPAWQARLDEINSTNRDSDRLQAMLDEEE